MLLINYNPPQEETNFDKSSIDSEYSQLIQEEAFVSRDDIIEDEVFLLEETCSTNNLFLISNDVWKIKIDLPSGKISYLELTDYPKTSGSSENKLLLNECGLERYSHTSGFAFLDKTIDSDSLFKLSENYKDGLNNVYVFEKKSDDLLFKKFISFESKDYLLKIKDTVQNLSPEEIKLAAYSKLDRSAEVVESKGSGFTDPSSFAYLGPAFRTE